MEETGILENPELLILVLPVFEPGRISDQFFDFVEHWYTGVLGLILGPWFLVLGPWSLVDVRRFLVLGH
jgi:hypothetical protein